MANTTTQPTINTYVSDMLALEKHVLHFVEHQTKDEEAQQMTHASKIIHAIFASTHAHIDMLERRLEKLGGHAGSPLKNSVASAMGMLSGTMSDWRKTEVSKYLRDDYGMLSMVSAGYTMLHATALGLGDAETADMAKQHLTDTATAVMRLSATLPSVVLAELKQEGVNVSVSVMHQAEQDTEQAWKNGRL